jgi:hypothetical protein
VPGSIRYTILPGLRRDDVITEPGLLDDVADRDTTAEAVWRRIRTGT